MLKLEKILAGEDMRYEKVKDMKDVEFKRLVGVKGIVARRTVIYHIPHRRAYIDKRNVPGIHTLCFFQ